VFRLNELLLFAECVEAVIVLVDRKLLFVLFDLVLKFSVLWGLAPISFEIVRSPWNFILHTLYRFPLLRIRNGRKKVTGRLALRAEPALSFEEGLG
jgi:hypothetical protein